jgi:hypothetical protein
MDTINVKTVAGSMLPVENGRGYVGYAPCAPDDPDADQVIPGVTGLKRSRAPFTVPNTVYYRRAIACGDLVETRDAPAQLPAREAPAHLPDDASTQPSDSEV